MGGRTIVAAGAGTGELTRTGRPAVAGRLAALRAGTSGAETCLAVRDLVVVCSSSRSGSSAFGELLRRSPQLLSFSAEINPHVMIPTLGSGGTCDVVADPAPWSGGTEGLDVLRTELGNDIGQPAQLLSVDEIARQMAWRLTLQWPHEPIDRDVVHGIVAAVARDSHDAQALFLAALPRLIEAYPSVNPHRYDLPRTLVERSVPHAEVPAGPPGEPVVEMSPFVVPRAWRTARPDEAATLPVVTTTPRNAFRLPLLAQAFPNARVQVVHLTRNPAAAVNGLRDGWLHHGFFSCRSDVPLAISGYSDRFPEWGTTWWSYDVPPGWRDHVERSLPEVCAFQWSAAHRAAVAGAAAIGAAVHRIAFEDVVSVRREPALRRLAAALDIDATPLLNADTLPVVMPTAPPRPRRWLDNAAVLDPVLRDPRIRAEAAALGYPEDPADWE